MSGILMMNLPQKRLFSLHPGSHGYFQKMSRKCSETLTTLLIGVNSLDAVKSCRLAHENNIRLSPSRRIPAFGLVSVLPVASDFKPHEDFFF